MMERSYRRRHSVRRSSARRGSSAAGSDDKATRRRTIKLAACGIIFVLAAILKLLFPGVVTSLGTAITTAVDYKSALAALGEGISGDKAFVAAVGEAITYAFRGTPLEGAEPGGEDVLNIAEDDATAVFSEDGADIPSWDYGGYTPEEDAAAITPDEAENEADDIPADDADAQSDLADAIISAFLQTQDSYADYDLPAGTTYDMPVIGAAYAPPLTGSVTSQFGYRTHPVDGGVKFHYGIDIAADEGAPITAFADGTVAAIGESTTLGLYVIITHDGMETLYAHCSEMLVSSGQAVAMGQQIAGAGSTGNATSGCLHFELKIGGIFVNPGYYILAHEEI